MKIITHPDNEKHFEQIREDFTKRADACGIRAAKITGFDIILNELIPPEKPSKTDMNFVEDSIEQITRLYYQTSEMLLRELGCNMDNVDQFEIRQQIGFDQPREFWKNGRKVGEVSVETKISDGGVTFMVVAELIGA